MLFSIAAISLGAGLGAVGRWLLGVSLNAMLPSFPLGTLVANLLGGYLIGVAVAVFSQLPHLAPEWRLLVITGFLGGLTTFSTFSAEVIGLVQQAKWDWAALIVTTHVLGSLLLTVAGMATVFTLRKLG